MDEPVIFESNEDFIEEITSDKLDDLVVYSRDWTVATIIEQITQNNIDLNPKFQRRNAWTDKKRSLLIESLICGMPVPEIVLAEDIVKKKAFIVLDGKQRLLTISGFANPDIKYWDEPVLRDLTRLKEINGKHFEALSKSESCEQYFRSLLNADVRCTVIANYSSPNILYDIFYRLNTTSTPLSTQELRQVLNKGPFADYLVEVTETPRNLHKVLGLNEPDPRLWDVEILLRFICFELFRTRYAGNLKKFLDDSMAELTRNWASRAQSVRQLHDEFDSAIASAAIVFDGHDKVGRKFVDGRWERRFNRVLFEVEIFYFHKLLGSELAVEQRALFLEGFKELFADLPFRSSVESTTKSLERYQVRFEKIQGLVNRSFTQSLDYAHFQNK